MTAYLGRGIAALGMLVVILSGCGDSPSDPPPPPPDEGILSDAVAGQATTCPVPGAARSPAVVTQEDVAYASLPPGAVPEGATALVRNASSPITVAALVIDGGFDPVPVAAHPGDTIELVVRNAAGTAVLEAAAVVPPRRRPVVVRTDPPPRKRDVPLNSRLVLIFSEPVAASSLTPGSVQLFRGSTAVAGTVRLLEGSATAAVFETSQSLDPNTDYRLVVTANVKDLEGDALESDASVEFTTGSQFVGPPNSVSIAPDTAALVVCSQIQLVATARDSFGTIVSGLSRTWASDDPSVATVSEAGLVTARAPGIAHISGDGSITGPGSSTIIVAATLAPVDSIAVSPSTGTIPLGAMGGTIKLTAALWDSVRNPITFRAVEWATSNAGLATVLSASGRNAIIRAADTGSVTITATSEGVSASATLEVVSVGAFTDVRAGGPDFYNHGHTCAVTTDGWALCWGVNQWGQTGTGIGGFTSAPVGIGGIPMSTVAPSLTRGCGLSPIGEAYCWGDNRHGGLGIGTTAAAPETCFGSTPCSQTPLAVVGGQVFITLGIGHGHACGLTAAGEVYCWGYNGEGQLGIGSTTGPVDCSGPGYGGYCSPSPIAVTGGFTFTSLTVGGSHTCGLTAAGTAYCWGYNGYGALGDSTNTDRAAPVRVVGGHTFIALSASGGFTCGLAADSSAYCWGENWSGQLGIGTTTGPDDCGGPCSKAPVAVATTLRFSALGRGNAGHMCAIATDGQAFCWGYNEWGQLGNGSTSMALVPVAVSGGLTFASISVAGFHSCGVSVAGVAYCWGDNAGGQLGTGSMAGSTVPVKVAGQDAP